MKIAVFTFVIFSIMCRSSFAGEANVLEVTFSRMAGNELNVSATVQHDDEGWKHYADRWEILDMEGNILDTRTLMHPHSDAPFTRSLPMAKIPDGMEKIRVRAHDNVHGYGGEEIVIEIPLP